MRIGESQVSESRPGAKGMRLEKPAVSCNGHHVSGCAKLVCCAQICTYAGSSAQDETVYLDDQSGFPGVGDKAFQELTKWGRFKVASDRKDADLILLLSAREHTGRYMTTSVGQVYSSAGGAYGNATRVKDSRGCQRSSPLALNGMPRQSHLEFS